MSRYIKLWWMMSLLTAQISFRSSFGASIFLIGKLLRLIFFVLFIILLSSNTKTIGGFSLWQMILFFATFNLVDIIPQFIFREVYRFRDHIKQGTFDFILAKPISPLFRSLFGGSDILDIPVLILSIGIVIVAATHLENISILSTIVYIAMLLNGFLIALSFYIATLSLGILTTEVDHTIMVYRDLTQMGRLPIDIYLEPIKSFITFVIPIGIMMTFPAKALMSSLSSNLILLAFVFSFVFFFLSLRLWRYALTKYQSASS